MRRLVQFVLFRLAGSMLALASRLNRRPALPFGSKDMFGASAARALKQASKLDRTDESPNIETSPSDETEQHETPARDSPAGYVQMVAKTQLGSPYGHAILLADSDEQRFIPVFVGHTEALAFQHRLAGTRFKRPLTHDLIDRLFELFHAQLDHIRIERIESDVYHATVVLNIDEQPHELDARASDAIVLAVSNNAPIFVAQSVVDRAGRQLSDIENDQLAELSPFQPP